MKLEHLNVYNLASEIGDEIWKIVACWNKFEQDTIGKQLVRAADSISANISEGFGRYFYKENKQFCYYARGSMMETYTWISKAKTRMLINENVASDLMMKLEALNIKLNAYIKSIGNTGTNLPGK